MKPLYDWPTGLVEKIHYCHDGTDDSSGESGMVEFLYTDFESRIDVKEIWFDGMTTKQAEKLCYENLDLVESFVDSFAKAQGYYSLTMAEDVLIFGRMQS